MQRQYVRFQMKHSTRPQTIAEVYREVDIKSFRENPEWYEIKEEEEAHVEPNRVIRRTKVKKELQ